MHLRRGRRLEAEQHEHPRRADEQHDQVDHAEREGCGAVVLRRLLEQLAHHHDGADEAEGSDEKSVVGHARSSSSEAASISGTAMLSGSKSGTDKESAEMDLRDTIMKELYEISAVLEAQENCTKVHLGSGFDDGENVFHVVTQSFQSIFGGGAQEVEEGTFF